MSKHQKRRAASAQDKTVSSSPSSEHSPSAEPSPGRFAYLKKHWAIAALIAVLSLGALGAGLKYLDEDARREIAKRNAATLLEPVKNESALNAVNPFLPAAGPTPTPQLSKEYIYAGSRLLAVEDANANAAGAAADLAVWRPATGDWYVMGPGGTMAYSVTWGVNGDEAVPADYDGDGKTDVAVYRPSNGGWYILKSSDGTLAAHAFGASGDKTIPADYDGDGRTDIAVWRMSTGEWFILKSSDSSVSGQLFGISSDIPSPADYDGDGRADIAVWRNIGGASLYIRRSSNNQLETIDYGIAGDILIPADYDGDGKADMSLRRNNDWHIRYANGTQTATTFQLATDRAVPNDYDGDGKVDIAVWRNATGKWYIRQSSKIGQPNELLEATWGTSGDIPVPGIWRR